MNGRGIIDEFGRAAVENEISAVAAVGFGSDVIVTQNIIHPVETAALIIKLITNVARKSCVSPIDFAAGIFVGIVGETEGDFKENLAKARDALNRATGAVRKAKEDKL